MYIPVDFISVSKSANKGKTPEVAGSIAKNTNPAPMFSTTTETAGSIACAAPAATSSAPTSSFCAVA